MSTFMGRLEEFPDIQVDYFRRDNLPPPLACFLSHVHSDHLSGLGALRSPFVYCSAATREILLRLETYACRVNYAKDILEAQQQTYKHLKRILKPLPLNTPTPLDLQPGLQIRVTLFDANHCPGAVMFLIEDAYKAILYTGDIRSEPWFVNSLVRNPSLIEYTSGIKTLDKIYLDTSFTRDTTFQTKAQGIEELLRKVLKYPSDTIFHFQAWTYGYEEVWIALSNALKSPVRWVPAGAYPCPPDQIHVDDYKLRIYRSLRVRKSDGRFDFDVYLSPEAPALVGYMSGNTPQPGCLTSDCNVRLHSCERGNMCSVAKDPSVVHIQPVIAHLSDGADLAEIGAGGGWGDLEREAELDLGMPQDVKAMAEIIGKLADHNDAAYVADAQNVVAKLALESANERSNIPLHLDASVLGYCDQKALLEKAVKSLAQRDEHPALQQDCAPPLPTASRPRTIRFPYSRHSSYPELCHLLEAFRPVDVWPCTVSVRDWREQGLSISSLFGECCSGNIFCFDDSVLKPAILEADHAGQAPQASILPTEHGGSLGSQQSRGSEHRQGADDEHENIMDVDAGENSELSEELRLNAEKSLGNGSKRSFDDYMVDDDDEMDDDSREVRANEQRHDRGCTSSLSARHSIARREAYYNMLEYMNNDVWTPIGLISTGHNHSEPEMEL